MRGDRSMSIRRGRGTSPWEDFFSDSIDEWTSRIRSIRSDVYETHDTVVVQMAVPGVDPEAVNVSVTGDTLTVSGETREEQTDEQRDYYQKQIRYGQFAQSVVLPSTVRSEEARAQFKNGMLTITLPKSEEAKPKRITIDIEEERGRGK